MNSYDNFAQTFSESRKNHPWPELDYIIADMKREKYTSVLDIGCGNGRLLEEVESSGYVFEHYFGIDSSSGMIEEARKLHPVYDFGVCDMLALGADVIPKHGSYDALLFLASFHHLALREERLRVLLDMKKFLAPRGRIYMTNWNLLDQVRYEKSHRGDGDFDIKIGVYSRYYHGFGLPELGSLFLEAGYDIIEHRIFEGGRNILSIITIS